MFKWFRRYQRTNRISFQSPFLRHKISSSLKAVSVIPALREKRERRERERERDERERERDERERERPETKAGLTYE